jgi:hypothetical protein
MKKITLKTAGILTAAALTLSLASCGAQLTDTSAPADTAQTTTAQTQSTDSTENAELKNPGFGGRGGMAENLEQSGTKVGRITSIDGDSVTVSVSDRGMRGGFGGMKGQRPDFAQGENAPAMNGESGEMQTPPDLPDGEEMQTPPDLPDGEQAQTPSDLPDGEQAQTQPQTDGSGQGRDGISADTAAETITLKLSDITKDGAAVSAEELSEGDMVMITMDEQGSAVSAQIMQRPERGGMRDGGAPTQENTAPAGESADA